MKWEQVTITGDDDRKYQGKAADEFIQRVVGPDLYGRHIKTLESGAFYIISDPKGYRVIDPWGATIELKKLLGESAKDVEVELPPVKPQPALAPRRGAPNPIAVAPPTLKMYLDGDRDGEVDAAPANYGDWQWGGGGHLGGIIMVAGRYPGDDGHGRGAENVPDRFEVRFRWDEDAPPAAAGWKAKLTVDRPARVRIFRGRQKNAAEIALGDPGVLNLEGGDFAPLRDPGTGQFSLWMEARQFPSGPDEDAWRVKLTYQFEPAHGAKPPEQKAQLRIAPWIMASDLDPTRHVWARVTEDEPNPLVDGIGAFAGASLQRQEIKRGKSKKGFARDVMKSGYSCGPHHSGIMIQKNLDPGSPVGLMADKAANVARGGTFVPTLSGVEPTAQDNGGNLLVSPPSDDYPWGRILYGATADPYLCRSADFYAAQRYQRPLSLDSTWLRVGHVDEMLSFIRADGEKYYALLMSPRLATIILEGVARGIGHNSDDLIEWAGEHNDEWIGGGHEGAHGGLDHFLGILHERMDPPAAPHPPLLQFHSVGDYRGNPPVPAAENFVVIRTEDVEIGTGLFGGQSADIQTAQRDRRLYEIRVHTLSFIHRHDGQDGRPRLGDYLAMIQSKLDGVRKTLRDELGFTDADIIDIPVLLNVEQGNIVALTGDSVNSLVLRNGDGCKCLIPKPFGPVYHGEYVFERYIAQKVGGLPGVSTTFLCDDDFHVLEGEIHCGTNQVHSALAGDLRKWWKREPD